MSTMELKLQRVWGATTLEFCKACGRPSFLSGCGHGDSAPWTELDERQRTLVRWQAIQKAKAGRSTHAVLTVAS